MTKEKNVIVQERGGIGILGMTFIVFLVLKLCKVISWSWWLITAPLWGPLAIGIAVFILIILGMGIAELFKK